MCGCTVPGAPSTCQPQHQSLAELERKLPPSHLIAVACSADPAIGGYQVHVVEGEAIVADAIRRIHQAGVKHHLRQDITTNLAARFVQAATVELDPPIR